MDVSPPKKCHDSLREDCMKRYIVGKIYVNKFLICFEVCRLLINFGSCKNLLYACTHMLSINLHLSSVIGICSESRFVLMTLSLNFKRLVMVRERDRDRQTERQGDRARERKENREINFCSGEYKCSTLPC